MKVKKINFKKVNVEEKKPQLTWVNSTNLPSAILD